ncbi:MAG: hypothetical protein JO369_08550 [Paucibacter sp.]|nr:hypothetical protein [Roseateles sp.]
MPAKILNRLSQSMALALMVAGGLARADSVTFQTFVSESQLDSALGQSNTIGITYAGDEFVGSVYFGQNNLQLYSTNLSGGNVQLFGSPLPDGGGETVLAASLGLGGFSPGNIFASGADSNIYMYGHSGGTPTLFATIPGQYGTTRQIFFDPGSSFGGQMLVTTTAGAILSFAPDGKMTVIALLGQDSEGMDIASSNYGQYAGQLLISSEGSGEIHAVSSTGVVTLLMSSAGGAINIGEAETVSTVPLNLGQSGNPVEGFYVADYPYDIQHAGASDFSGMLGNTIVTDEYGSDSGVWELVYNGDAANNFNVVQVGSLPYQSEDGIFVTAQRISDITGTSNGNTVPEPGTWGLAVAALAALWISRHQARRHP